MPHHYHTIPGPPSHHYETINEQGIYSEEKPTDLIKHNWYHGNITEEQVDVILQSTEKHDIFLVRQSAKNLILSTRIRGWKSHDIIHHSPRGYHLEGEKEVFQTVPDMIAYYQHFPIKLVKRTADKIAPG